MLTGFDMIMGNEERAALFRNVEETRAEKPVDYPGAQVASSNQYVATLYHLLYQLLYQLLYHLLYHLSLRLSIRKRITPPKSIFLTGMLFFNPIRRLYQLFQPPEQE